jgi:hypothetical protein
MMCDDFLAPTRSAGNLPAAQPTHQSQRAARLRPVRPLGADRSRRALRRARQHLPRPVTDPLRARLPPGVGYSALG